MDSDCTKTKRDYASTGRREPCLIVELLCVEDYAGLKVFTGQFERIVDSYYQLISYWLICNWLGCAHTDDLWQKTPGEEGDRAEGGFVDGSRTARISNERGSKPKKGDRAANNYEALVVTVLVLVCLLRLSQLTLSQRVKNSVWTRVLVLSCHKVCIARGCWWDDFSM